MIVKSHASRNRGLASVIAILMIALVGVGLGAIAVQLSHQAKQDRLETLDARTRQMVIAAAYSVRHRLDQGLDEQPIVWDLIAPTEGIQEKVNISVRMTNTDQAVAQLEIVWGDQIRRHRLVFAKVNSTWQLRQAGQSR